MDYRETLNLPETHFPMKASLLEKEPESLARWEKEGLYHRLLELRAGRKRFVLHDGPPYANGDVHIGTAFNKISKDIIVRFKSMQGYFAPFVPGWDCHGMPIEHKVVESLPQGKQSDRMQIRKACRAYAEKFVSQQRRQFQRLGVWGDWERPYLTMAPEYQATIVRLFGALAGKGFIYRGLKPVYWCPACGSALAEAEVEYAEHTSPSITVRFQVTDQSPWPAALGARPERSVAIPIWTTTPWTLPANRAVAVHPDFVYVLAQSENELFILARERVAAFSATSGMDLKAVAEFPGEILEGMQLDHPFLQRTVPVILGKHVTLDAGTGAVHTAPGHGQEDFMVGQEYHLEVFNPVGPDGRFNTLFAEMEGVSVFQANPQIIDRLSSLGRLVAVEKLTHAYPHCWRHRTPVIFRATEQWFMNVDQGQFRQQVLSEIEKGISWYPAVSRNRIAAMVQNRPDWCLSRQRNWGVAIPVAYCRECRTPVMQSAVCEHVAKLIEHHGADVWFEREEADLLPPGITCGHCGGKNFQKETDILDVWFDSGASHAAVLDLRPELGFPADLYLEGSDQHRGWFQVSLLTAMGTRAQAPFRAVLTHGYTVDGEGKKMSKSLGNFITAEEGIQKYGGADLLRLWVVSENIQNDVRISQEIMTRVTDTYRRVRNSLRFLLGNLRGFDPNAPAPLSAMSALDRTMLHRLAEFVTRSREAFEQYETYRFYQALQNFCSNDLSAFYFDAMKDCLYADGPHSRSRHAVQTVLWWILRHLTRLIAPVLVHTADETWQAMREQNLLSADEDLASVHLAEWLAPDPAWQQADLAAEWEQLGKLRDAVMKEIEKERIGKNIRHTYEAMVRLAGWSHPRQQEPEFVRMLEQFFVVSKIEILPGTAQSEPHITILAAPGRKCERCWRVLESVGQTHQHPTLCQRCAEVVTALEPKPLAQEPK